MSVKKFAIGAAALLLTSTAASAATQFQTVSFSTGFQDTEVLSSNFGRAEVAQFDSSLGTLVGLTWTITREVQGDVEFFTSGSQNQQVTGNFSLDFDLFNLVPGDWDATGATSENIVVNFGGTVVPGGLANALVVLIDETRVATGSIPGGMTGSLTDWVGNGTVGFDYSTLSGVFFTGGGGQVGFSQFTQAGVTFEVTYEYEAVPGVIPLPAAGWLLLSGIAGLGGLGYFRRRTTA
ncbi:MAG: choice-of-anchor E domain-containing protein [Alkalilacustris sp.]